MGWVSFFTGMVIGLALAGVAAWLLSRLNAFEETWIQKRKYAGVLPIEHNAVILQKDTSC